MSRRLGWSTLALLLAFPITSGAGPIYDFSTLDTNNGPAPPAGSLHILGTGITTLDAGVGLGAISAFALQGNGNLDTPATLIVRNVSNDHGLGVCSSGEPNCAEGTVGGGDDNELSLETNGEAIVLQRPINTLWDGLWVSSLDNNDGLGPEGGTLGWGNTLGVLLGSFSFAYPAFGGTAVEGKLDLTGSGFDPTALFVVFVPGTANIGNNTDYLVWGADLKSAQGDVPVPEPLSLLLVGTGLPALAWRRRSRR